jgi:hypothetical protein
MIVFRQPAIILYYKKTSARIVRHGRYIVFQLAEVAVPRVLFVEILRRIDRLRSRETLF